MELNRYSHLVFNNKMQNLPSIKIKSRETDLKVVYNPDKTRLDRLSFDIYGQEGYGWLILMANPEYYMEFDIPKNTVIRIPFPLKEVETEFVSQVLAKKDK